MAKIEYDVNTLRPYTMLKEENLENLNETVYTNYEGTVSPKTESNLNETKIGLEFKESKIGGDFEGRVGLKINEGKRSKLEGVGEEQERERKEDKPEHICLNEEELYEFRTNQCKLYLKNECPNSNRCKNSHSETWPRRNPLIFKYDYKLCPNIQFFRLDNKMQLYGKCNFGRKCKFSHSKEEQLYHPNLYKTRFCLNYPNCKGYYCPFAHCKSELRTINSHNSHPNNNYYNNSSSNNYNNCSGVYNNNSYSGTLGNKSKYGKCGRVENDVSSTNTESTYGANETLNFEEEFTISYNFNNSNNFNDAFSANNNDNKNSNTNYNSVNSNKNNNNVIKGESNLNETHLTLFRGIEEGGRFGEGFERMEEGEKEDNWFDSLIKNGLNLLEDGVNVHSGEFAWMDKLVSFDKFGLVDKLGTSRLNLSKWDDLLNVGNINDLLSGSGRSGKEEFRTLEGKLSKAEEEEENNSVLKGGEKAEKLSELGHKYVKDEMFKTIIVEKVCPLCLKKEREMVLGSFEIDNMIKKSEEIFKLWD